MRFRLCFALCCCLSLPTLANETACTQTIQIGASPLGSNMTVSADNQVGGMYPDLLKLIAANSPCRFSYQIAPRVRTLKWLQDGETIDMLVPVVRTTERDQAAEFVHLLNAQVQLIYPKRLQGDPIALLNSGKLRVNVVRGFDYGPSYHALLTQLKNAGMLEEVVDAKTLVRKLQVQRLDATLMVPQNMASEVKEAGLESELSMVALTQIPPIQSGAYLSYRRLDPATRQELRRQFNLLLRNGSFWRLFQNSTPSWALTANSPATPH
ncbi:transporter substrate-binding domain-containing protein [Chitinibacter sp. SCUT-21]|uniref:substrate-binding periplasmic protein n=1 Tax=Chitinibacter sp. SCUT-21 TaxID=2970891 RepID=UPI0035A64640